MGVGSPLGWVGGFVGVGVVNVVVGVDVGVCVVVGGAEPVVEWVDGEKGGRLRGFGAPIV